MLVVDDIEDNRELYGSYFEAMGYRVVHAVDGVEALEVVARDAPDVVLMDLAMPRLDGWEATTRIKSNPRTKHVVVVVITGFATRDELARARAAGADEVCVKPCTPKDVLARVEALLRQSRR